MANWSSYEEAAKAGYSNIATQREWARTSNKMGYSSYQDYLNGMYAKYISSVNPASKVDNGSDEKESTGSSSGAIPTVSSGLENYSSEGGKTSPKYQGSNFLDWYSSNYGKAYDQNQGFSRAEGMSDVDWDIGNETFKYYVSGQNIDNQYKNNINALEQNKKNSQQNASITLDKLKKYLPTQVKAQGLGGLGVSESTMLQAYNNYNNQMGQIAEDYNGNKTSLEEAYGSQKTDLDLAANEAVNSIAKNYSDKYETDQKEARGLLYNDFVSKVQNGSFNTTYELERDYEKIKNSLTKTQQQLIEGRIQTLKNSAASKQSDSDWYRSSFYKDGNVISQENAETALLSIKNDSNLDSAEKSRYQAAFEELYPNSYYTSTNMAKANSKSQYDLYNALTNTNISKDKLSKVNINTIQTNSPFGEWEIYWYGKGGWYCYSQNGTDYWYKRK